MDILWTAAAFLVLMLAGLVGERIWLERRLSRIPLRIAVTGTRGKSTVTRLLAAILSESGLRVVAKTTGSKPRFILPDGTEREIARLGLPSVLEQRKVLGLASRLSADAVVAEMMSIRPEYLAVESRFIFKPRLVLITNVRLDHEEELGRTKADVAAALAAAISDGATVLLPAEENDPVFARVARTRKALLRLVPDPLESPAEIRPAEKALCFPENSRLALAAADILGIDGAVARRGLARARPDFGGLALFSAPSPLSGESWDFVNGFAANEPESSQRALSLLESTYPAGARRRIALLALRSDRAGRTRQWLEAVRAGFFAGFSNLVFIGDDAAAIGRARRWRGVRGPEISAVAERRPEEIMRRLWPLAEGEARVIGLGNIVGVSGGLVEYWSTMGERLS